MANKAVAVDWEDILSKFATYKGTIKSFCKENNISPHQFYYQRKAAKKRVTPVFHAIDFKEDAIPSNSSLTSSIKIEIGKAKIHIPSHDRAALTNILGMIMESC
ncbi:hypothetical protein SAMN05661008_01829 [Alkalithermobacter thermoalcaliphilus JW-YL-7 = DSM 7308]|uniref:Transposase n=1 Tax=Alkalithermobacter thermoalcaliphilus JW-YL-7 = DSM 7308 TaxID=1121328 RepID=A0A150FQV9_CLOPD|nr:hypothetical protein JWYL7_1054 [[Clostridium] paradoxum JW-YL-7 = DSM 7308]SHL29606.1 hypothetical protein SAMN05661008_01829 [[Clostridium] paradoxum JW-YL-7 = DSM 7308]